ncbi:MAG TPA: toll/interleukin-1 receptor domain-containing protein [Pyrinomonadaceae bacterium]
MTILREYEEDIFISYAHIDNQSLVEGQKGWITSFHKALEIRLSQLLGDEPEVWRDESNMVGNQYIDDAIVKRLPRIAILVSVVTPRYINSKWCLKEVQEFYRFAEQTGGVRVSDKSRIFKVVKTPVPFDKHPPELQGILGYEFFRLDPTTGKPREFIFNSGPHADIHYWAKLDDLAYDIYQLMETLKAKPGAEAAAAADAEQAAAAAAATPPPGVTIYLAESTLDLAGERDQIRRELQQRGYRVLPDKPLPLNDADLRAAVSEDLRRSKLSVHLVGAHYGIVPEASDSSVVSLQNELAAERSRDPSFTRVIWMPPGLEVREERQRGFIDYLHNDPAAQHGAELLQTTIEDLKTTIQDKLSAASLQRAAAAASADDDAPRRVYLICDSQDLDEAGPVSDYLFEQGFEVITPVMEGDEAEVRADHKENLLLCDAILIYYGRAGDPWLRAKMLDLRKLAGYGRTKPLLAKAVFVAAPQTPAKDRFRTLEATVIRCPERFTPEPLRPLVAQLEATKGAQ